MWALGVILYELITLRKPFDAETINGVLQQIVKASYEPLPQDTDSDLKMLVPYLLNKDYSKRPSIFDVAAFPCVKKRILQFIEE